MSEITSRQPQLVIYLDGTPRIVPLRVLRECSRGQYMGCCAEMTQILAKAILDNYDGEANKH